MQQAAAQAYQKTAKQTASPRELESSLLYKSAGDLQRIRDNWDAAKGELFEALTLNRKVWTIFLEHATSADCHLPPAIQQNIANLGLFVVNHTLKVQTSPAPGKLDVLININREIAAGLRGT